ncbi:MAG: AAA family ATPase [Candidatus Sumerlaeia bacterium]|nr:AAA family ATPase [Candidatus Sumerlaeia bacterium]
MPATAVQTAPPSKSRWIVNPREEIEVLIKARYALLYVVSWEESRVLAELDAIAGRLGKRVYEWSVTHGITRFRAAVDRKPEGRKGTKDPILALREVLEFNEPSIFAFKDFHAYMKQTQIIRGLRDVVHALRNSYSSVVIVSPVVEVPPELEKELTLIDFPLPTREDLSALLQQIKLELAQNPSYHIDLSPAAEEKLLEAAIGLTLQEAENVFAKTLVLTQRLTETEAPLIYSEKKQIIRKSGLLEYVDSTEQIEGVGGLRRLKAWLAKRRLAFSREARQFGLPVPKGVLFLGVQGCGKSLCAKAVASLWRLPLLRLDMGRVFSSYVGTSEENVRRAIRIAESVAPAILWIDEIDKGFSGVQSSAFSDSGTTARVFGTILTWLQEKQAPVFVIATANNVEILPPELLRKGRFDEIFFVDLPNEAERQEIFAIHLAKRNRPYKAFDLAQLAKAAEGFSGAEIEQCVVSAMYDAFEQGRDIDTGAILKAIRETYPISVTLREQIEYRRKWAAGRTRPAT